MVCRIEQLDQSLGWKDEMGDFQLFAGQLMILFQLAVGGAALWGAARLMTRLTRKDA